MENSAHAVKMILGVIVFGLALTIALNLFSQIRRTSQSFLFSNEEDYSYKEENISGKQKRIVGLETVVPTIFNYYNSKSVIYLKKGNYNQDTGELTNISNINLYYSSIRRRDFNYLDYEEEKKTKEPWTNSVNETKNFVKSLLYTNKNKELYDIFSENPTKEKKFVEVIGTSLQDNEEKTVIEYVFIK